MSKEPSKTPKLTERAQEAKAKKAEALKSALRENLHKRKAQARAKKSAGTSQ